MRIITNRSWVFGCDIEIKLQSSRLKAGAVRSTTKSIYVAILNIAQYMCPPWSNCSHQVLLWRSEASEREHFDTSYLKCGWWQFGFPKMTVHPHVENVQVSHSKLKSSLSDFFTRWVGSMWLLYVSQIKEEGSWRNFEKLTADCA